MRIAVTIQGLAPLLMNRFTEAAEVKMSGGTSVAFRGDRGTPRQQAEPKAYRQESGELFVPGANIFSCLIAAGQFTKAGKSKLTTMKTSLIPAGLAVEDMVCALVSHDGRQLTDFEIDSRSVVIPSTGGRIMCHRPRVDEWRCRFTVDIDTEMFTANLVRSVVDDGGKKIGLGDFRPQRKGPFGRFAVVGWEVLEEGLRGIAQA